jgi:two-component system, NarL family, response regulator NreC
VTTVVLADDHAIVRRGLRALLEMEPDIVLVGETEDGLETVRLVEQLSPDILIVDLVMPGLGGLEVTRQVRKSSPQTHVIVLSMHANEAYVLEALRNGALGYILKGSQVDDLVRAIREVAAGRRYLSSPLSERAIDVYVQKSEASILDNYETLTHRERQVLHLIAEGHTNAEVAGRLFISSRTAETHRANVMRKLNLQNQTDVIRYAIRRGIISADV